MTSKRILKVVVDTNDADYVTNELVFSKYVEEVLPLLKRFLEAYKGFDGMLPWYEYSDCGDLEACQQYFYGKGFTEEELEEVSELFYGGHSLNCVEVQTITVEEKLF